VPDFIFRANIAHYKELLETETDARKTPCSTSYWQSKRPSWPQWCAKNPRPKPSE
jgi:hypothetical protein